MRLYINCLWKINPLWEQFPAVKARVPYIYTHFDVHISKHYSWLQLLACHLHLYKVAGRDSREVDPRYLPRYLLPSWQAVALWGALTWKQTNVFFYLRAPIMSSAANGGTGWLWQSNGPASLFPCVPDGNLSTLSYKLHFQKSHFHLDPNTDMRARQKEEHVLHRMLMASVFTASQSELLCVARRQWCDLLARPEVRLWSRVSVTQIIRFVSVVH